MILALRKLEDGFISYRGKSITLQQKFPLYWNINMTI
jgi:hypothetical protein